MAIRRVGGARKRSATRTANPRRKKRATSRKRTTSRKRKTTRRRKSTAISRKRSNPVRRRRRTVSRKRSNPRRRSSTASKALLKFAGSDMGMVAVGAASAVLVKNAINSLGFVQDMVGKLPAQLQPLASPALVVGAGWALHKYAKNAKLKKVGTYIAVTAVVLAVDDFASKQFGGMFGGAYHNYGGYGGAYHKFNGAYVQLPKQLSGSSFGGQHVGSSSMFGGITNLA